VRALAAALLALLALAGCGGDDDATTPVEDLTDLAALRSDFEAESGKTRVLLLFAPT
jgi:ABC-type glycerol-3-phosphate transport system substrate-binding protein